MDGWMDGLKGGWRARERGLSVVWIYLRYILYGVKL